MLGTGDARLATTEAERRPCETRSNRLSDKVLSSSGADWMLASKDAPIFDSQACMNQ
ncbi:MAG: hypothetical protein Q4D90_08510 [bacterium]|nr:hypothetical protein [bacterium]